MSESKKDFTSLLLGVSATIIGFMGIRNSSGIRKNLSLGTGIVGGVLTIVNITKLLRREEPEGKITKKEEISHLIEKAEISNTPSAIQDSWVSKINTSKEKSFSRQNKSSL